MSCVVLVTHFCDPPPPPKKKSHPIIFLSSSLLIFGRGRHQLPPLPLVLPPYNYLNARSSQDMHCLHVISTHFYNYTARHITIQRQRAHNSSSFQAQYHKQEGCTAGRRVWLKLFLTFSFVGKAVTH